MKEREKIEQIRNERTDEKWVGLKERKKSKWCEREYLEEIFNKKEGM